MMITVIHKKFDALVNAAATRGQELLQTPVAFYFRIFDKQGNCTRIHLFYKP